MLDLAMGAVGVAALIALYLYDMHDQTNGDDQ